MTTDTSVAIQKSSAIQLNIEQQCPIQYVTVYNDRAEVTRLVKHHFDAEGTYDLVFEGFSPFVDLTSLHVNGGTGKACTILEVSYETRFENSSVETESTALEQLQKEFLSLEEESEKHKQESIRIGKQRAWLEGRATKLMNQNTEKTGNDLAELEQFLQFYYQNLLKLDNQGTYEEKQIKILTEKLANIQAKITEYGADGKINGQKQKRLVTVTVHIGTTNLDVSLNIAYLISNCSWTASYDVRVNTANSTNQPQTQLTYYGIIVNKSQENWSDVQLSLSTAAPSLGGALPKLGTLKINFETPQFIQTAHQYKKSGFLSIGTSSFSNSITRGVPQMRERRNLTSDDLYLEDADESNNTINVLSTHTETSMSSTNFNIPRRSTIEADGKPHKVTVGVLDLASTFTYTVIPKLSPRAYLKASTINSSDKQLLAGPASVFMNNNFITHSSIDNVCLGDKFDLPLGVDASVKVDYKPVKKLADTHGFISKVHHENVRHEIHLTNLKTTEVIVYVYEQVPLSSDETIKIKIIQPDLRTKEQSPNCTVLLNDDNNIEWKCLLAAHGECRLPLEYTMEWPKERRVQLKQLQ